MQFDKDLHVFNNTQSLNAQLGQNGFELITDTSANTTGYYAIQVIEDTIFTALTGTNISGTFTGVTFTDGHVIFGQISSFTLASGKVLAYLSAVDGV